MHFKSPCMANPWLAGAPRVLPCCTSREAEKCPEHSQRTRFIWVWTQVRLQMRNTEEGISYRTRPQNAEAGECDSRSAVVSSSSAPLIDWVCKKHLAHRKQEGDWGNHQVVPMNYSHFAQRLPRLPAYIHAIMERHCQAVDTLWIKRDLREKAKCMCGTLMKNFQTNFCFSFIETLVPKNLVFKMSNQKTLGTFYMWSPWILMTH